MAAVWKVLDLLKFAKAGDINGTVTQIVSYALGIGAAFLFAQADIAETWSIPGIGVPLSTLDGWSLVLLGIIWASGGSALYDFKKAFDGTDSAQTPSLLPPPNHPAD
jgi:hypothetical protein